MIPYSTQDIGEGELAAVAEVLRSGWLTQGPAVPRFEAEVAQLHQVPHAVALNSATAGLHLACLALGVGPGTVVWTSPISYVASANCAHYCGADVDFVDVDPLTINMSVDALQAKLEHAKKNGKLPRVVIPVDFAGQPADLNRMRELADHHGFSIIEDASHAVGASLQQQPVGSAHCDLAVLSFHPVKIITTGEGGMVLARDVALAERLRLLRSHGVTKDSALLSRPSPGDWYYEQVALGYNYRLTDMQAALGSAQLARLGQFLSARQRLASRYDRLLAGLPLRTLTRLPDRESSLHLYPVCLDAGISRAEVFARMRQAGIGVQVHYIPIHLQPYWRRRGFNPGDLPNAEAWYAGAISLPLYPALTDAQQDEVVHVLREALARG
jgi:UDP-4-amino-4,6-dideoxy-N-acetyl-beta-L-altrosamine transaminase